ncbi:MAG: S16 family serine protease [Candidatus Eisenbacteria bacterium]
MPRQLEGAGLVAEDLEIPAETIQRLVRGYTREAGVRGLDREIAAIMRKTARAKATDNLSENYQVDLAELDRLLGPARYEETQTPVTHRIGVANGVAWSEGGGELLSIEVSTLPGSGQLTLTGRLGETMRESAQTAISFVRSRAHLLGLDPAFHRALDLHIHVPEGGIPKNGPSAGVTIALALVSALTGRPTRETVAASGEITLHGRVLPVGGLAEKAIAAHRSGMRTLLLPESNQRHLGEIPDDVRAALEIVLVSTMDEVLKHGLAKAPRRRGASKGKKPSERYYAA